jgi:hypothetical protein
LAVSPGVKLPDLKLTSRLLFNTIVKNGGSITPFCHTPS